MAVRLLKSDGAEFRHWLDSLIKRREVVNGQVTVAAARIIDAVRRQGDKALIAATRRFDGISLEPGSLRISESELASASKMLPKEQYKALDLPARRIRAFHCRVFEKSFSYRDAQGVRLGQIVRPLRRVGIYVPGGQASYPSSVLMTAIPAKVAGVAEIVMVCPIKSPQDQCAVLAAANLAGVTEVYRVGGAQAIAALAFGTETIAPVDKIVGPGNAYVQAAKRLVFGKVDVDTVAGPSEVLVVADEKANPRWVAADLIAQAEHGSGDECAVLLTPSLGLAEAVRAELESALKTLPRASQVRTALRRNGALVVVSSIDEAIELANTIAPEHLELEVRNPSKWLSSVKTAGAIFIGDHSPAPLGDYVAGPNHVLPTGGAARFASPLGVYDFIKRSSIIEASLTALKKLGPVAARLARLEGLEGHARAIELRLSH